VISIVVLAAALSACVPPPQPPPEPVPPTSTAHDLPVASTVRWFTDTSRGIPAYGNFGGSPTRLLPTTIWYPTDRGAGPYPLVIFAPGYGVGPDAYATLLSRIASAGYVVAAPYYPILSGWPAGPDDVADWADVFPDTGFVTTSMLVLNASGDPQLGGTIDGQRIAVAGHSDGALISFSQGYVAFRSDPRVRAVISYSALLGEPGTIYQPNGRPFLHLVSDNDEYNDFGRTLQWDRDNLADPRWTIGLWNASHAGPYMDPGDPHFDVVVGVTVAFLDHALKGASTLDLFLQVVARPDLSAFMG
jgi:dienelactone hydrolase